MFVPGFDGSVLLHVIFRVVIQQNMSSVISQFTSLTHIWIRAGCCQLENIISDTLMATPGYVVNATKMKMYI